MANTKENEKERARELYFTTNWRQSQIAERVGVSEKTISTWVIEGNWKAMKKAAFHSSQVEIHRLYEELRVISVNISKREPHLRFPTKEELDARTKILALINTWKNVNEDWRNVPNDHELVIPADFNTPNPNHPKLPVLLKMHFSGSKMYLSRSKMHFCWKLD